MGSRSLKCQSTFTGWPYRKRWNFGRVFGIFVFLTLAAILLCYSQYGIKQFGEEFPFNDSKNDIRDDQRKYLIRTSKCRIPDDDPFNEDVKKFFHKERYIPCSKKRLLTYVTKTDSSVTLHINQSLLSTYSIFKISCCYSAVSRIVTDNRSDDEISFSDCIPFGKNVTITEPIVMVKCKSAVTGEVYSNVHAIVSPKHVPHRKIMHSQQRDEAPLSVLFVGIDSISKMNLIRTMPKTHKFLEEHDFINIKGYTKIADNTFPNLMAILTGKTWQQVNEHCNPAKNKMNDCDMVWDRFNDLNYITAYVEDETDIGTFNYNKLGFSNPPTDFYWRPYMIAAEKLSSIKRYGMHICSGPENSGERIMNLVREFTITFKDYPKFGLFWMNSFSHNNINLPSSMDEKVELFLSNIYGYLQNTIFVFFSDHGFRFGDIRYTHTGWMEERLPFIYIHIPRVFKEQRVEEFRNFMVNTKRLTTPFDIYMTLQDILLYTNSSYLIQSSQACPKCHSLFKEVDEARSCDDGAIAQHWCMCTGHSYVNPSRRIIKKAAEFIISEINALLKSSEKSTYCAEFYLKRIIFSGMSDVYLNEKNQSVNYFMLMIETRPPAMFEATVEVPHAQKSTNFRLLGDISRINRYGDNSQCIEGSLKKYCYCDELFTSIKSAICNFVNCL